MKYSSFVLEFIVMKQFCEYLHVLRYIFGYNQYMIANQSIPDLTINKKNQSITYHFICAGAACDKFRLLYVNTHNNKVYLMTNILPYGYKSKGFVLRLMYHIFG